MAASDSAGHLRVPTGSWTAVCWFMATAETVEAEAGIAAPCAGHIDDVDSVTAAGSTEGAGPAVRE